MLPIAYTTPLEPGNFYHVYNRGNNHQQVFSDPFDYTLFLLKWREFIQPVARTFAYNLLPNHFHAIVQIRDEPLNLIVPPLRPNPDLAGMPLLADCDLSRLLPETFCSGTPKWVSRGFTNFFISYSRKMQKLRGFHGAVFHSPFKRKLITDEMYFDYLTSYIHFNDNKHSLDINAHRHPFSSYLELISDGATFLERDFMMDRFGGKEGFIRFHEDMSDWFNR